MKEVWFIVFVSPPMSTARGIWANISEKRENIGFSLLSTKIIIIIIIFPDIISFLTTRRKSHQDFIEEGIVLNLSLIFGLYWNNLIEWFLLVVSSAYEDILGPDQLQFSVDISTGSLISTFMRTIIMMTSTPCGPRSTKSPVKIDLWSLHSVFFALPRKTHLVSLGNPLRFNHLSRSEYCPWISPYTVAGTAAWENKRWDGNRGDQWINLEKWRILLECLFASLQNNFHLSASEGKLTGTISEMEENEGEGNGRIPEQIKEKFLLIQCWRLIRIECDSQKTWERDFSLMIR